MNLEKEELKRLLEEKISDLEQKNRELEVEAALEEVRARTMAMQHSNELSEAAFLMAQQVRELGIKAWGCAFHIYAEDEDGDFEWFSNEEAALPFYKTPRKRFFKDFYDLRVNGETLYVKEFKGKECADHYKYMMTLPVVGEALKGLQDSGKSLPTSQIDHVAYFKYGYLLFITYEPVPEAYEIFKRFAKEFEQTYRRFLDLQKAEAQTREAQVELSLERIRSQVTAMRESTDLLEIVVMMQAEFNKLGHEAHYFWHMRWLPDKYEKALTNGDGTRIGNVMELPRGFHGLKIMLDWEKTNEPSAVFALDPETAADYIDKMIKLGRFQEIDHSAPGPDEVIDMGGLTFVMARTTHGEIGYTLPGVVPNPPEEDLTTLVRFAGVFDLAYRRFEDLKSAEKQLQEAVRQSSLDRIRGQIASMRNANDLQQITPLIWNELKNLEVPFFRCGVFIIDDKEKQLQAYLTTPDGKSLGVLDLDFDLSDMTRNSVASWRKSKVYQSHWDREDFIAWTNEMLTRGQIRTPEEFQGSAAPPESLHLHFIPFAQGMLYVGNEEPLGANEIDLVKSLAEAFSFAYARYQDFVVLEEAKERVEQALGDLKATQSQLIHAEKMASLGELTAGIAHEIQNPLNFVNNFSDVSADLVQELREELQNGEVKEVEAISDDLLQNLEKISHHGNRASNIVKSMLEHSRAGSGEKQVTDINTLADEYLRLAYHGLRAKDKSFNSDFRMEAKEDLPKVKVTPQDLGRVLLNLINNAFYAVSERRKQGVAGYKPTVIVSTHKKDEAIEIRVNDNGSGIPDSVKEKIFQPFFTTKPTGQGTGLGLSMSYDIISKGHGGSLSVKSETNVGTDFTINIPIMGTRI